MIGLLTAIWALVGAPRPWQVASEITASTVTLSHTEIILDASAGTAAAFAGETKLEASQDAVAQFVLPLSNEGVALRRAGGGCDEAGELVVGFGSDQGEEVREEAAAQRPEGKSNIANAVRAAIDDFNESAFRAPNTTERILIFMNGEDECGGEASEIRDALDGSEVDADFRLVALSPSRAERRNLMSFKRELASYADVEVRTPATKRELKEVVKHEVRKAVEVAAAARHDASSSGSPSGEADGGGESAGEADSSGGQGSGSSSGAKDGAADRRGEDGQRQRNSGKKDKGKKDKVEEDCADAAEAESEGAEAERTEAEAERTEAEAERTEAEPVGAERTEQACADAGLREDEGAKELTPPEEKKDETMPTVPVQPESEEAPKDPSSTTESTTSTNGVALRLPFGGIWRRPAWRS